MLAHSSGSIEIQPETASTVAHKKVPAKLKVMKRRSDIPEIPARGGEMCETPGMNLVYSSERSECFLENLFVRSMQLSRDSEMRHIKPMTLVPRRLPSSNHTQSPIKVAITVMA